jgi:hypothetical protein
MVKQGLTGAALSTFKGGKLRHAIGSGIFESHVDDVGSQQGRQGTAPCLDGNETPHEQAEPYRRFVKVFRWLTEKDSSIYSVPQYIFVFDPQVNGSQDTNREREVLLFCKRLSSDTGSIWSRLSQGDIGRGGVLLFMLREVRPSCLLHDRLC